MRKLSIFTIGLSGFTCLGVIAFVYQFWVSDTVKLFDHSTSFTQQTMLLTRSEAAAAVHRNAINQLKSAQEQNRQPDSAMVNYALLPDMHETAAAKAFLMAIGRNGFIGEHATFQHALDSLSTTQILSNMLLMKEDAYKLKTVLISSNMLNRQQLESCFAMTQHLLQSLKFMYNNNKFTSEQEKILNVAFARLTYLTRTFSFELKKFD